MELNLFKIAKKQEKEEKIKENIKEKNLKDTSENNSESNSENKRKTRKSKNNTNKNSGEKIKKKEKELKRKLGRKNKNKSLKESNENEEIGKDKESRIKVINCSKSFKLTLAGYNSIGLSYSLTMDISDKDNPDEKKEELSRKVQEYIDSEVEVMIDYYKKKIDELNSVINEYNIKLNELGKVKSEIAFLEKRGVEEKLDNED
jgi:hypothetical protein